MRGTRWLLLAAIVAIVAGVGATYRAQKKLLREQTPNRPAALRDDLNSTGQDWVYTQSTSAYTKVEASAKEFEEAKDSGRVDLKGLVLKLHNLNGKTYDLVNSEAAVLFKNENRLYSEGEVRITLDVPEEGTPTGTLVSITSSGVTVDTGTGRVETERPVSFVLPNGAGQATGALYDSGTRQLTMKNAVSLDWKGRDPKAKAMKIEAGGLEYREAASEIWLRPWGKLTRGTTVVEGENATVRLENGSKPGEKLIRKIVATKARGSDSYPKRKLDYSADELWVDLNDGGEVQKITAQTNARLQSVADASETNVSAHHVEMNFEMKDGDSALSTVSASGNAVVDSKPLPGPNRQPGETHVLRSETLDMKMRPGGEEIENVVTRKPAVLEFLPNLATQHRRVLNSNDMTIVYGRQNRVESFHAEGVRTQTDPTADELKRNKGLKPAITTSKTMSAAFDPKTGRLAHMEQEGDFTYEEGERRARAAKATLDGVQDVMLLETRANVWDPAGSTSADRIHLDQRTDHFTAEGNVQSSRVSDKNQKAKSSEMLSGDEPLLATARKMESTNRNRKIHYEGAVTMWQGANRIRAEAVDLDRDKRSLVADGNVVTNLWEKPKDPKKKAAAITTEVRAARLVYTEQDRLAWYTGGVTMIRPGLTVTSRELHAWLSESGGDSSLSKAFADGKVQIFQKSPERTRTGTAGHAEFYTDEQKIVLRDDRPKVVDSKGQATEADELTYFANDDRLLSSGSAAQPVSSRIKSTAKKSAK
jgi:lipopolysaccharide export system protein LptA